MPAGLLLSPTARTVRSGPGREPSRRRCRRPQVPLPRRQERPAARLRKVPWELPSPSCAVRRRGCSCGAFRSYRPQSRLPPAPIPGKVVGSKARPQDTPSPPGSRYGFPPLPGETRILPALPLSREYRSRCLPAPPVASDPPPVFSLPDLLRSGASVPLLPSQKIVRSTSIFPAIPAPLCKEK